MGLGTTECRTKILFGHASLSRYAGPSQDIILEAPISRGRITWFCYSQQTPKSCHSAFKGGSIRKLTGSSLISVQATEYVRRPQGLGLGAKPQEAEKPTKGGKGGREGKKQRPDLVYLDDSGRQRNVAPLGAKLVERPKEGVLPGKKMKVSSGPHAGLEVEVLALEPEVHPSPYLNLP